MKQNPATSSPAPSLTSASRDHPQSRSQSLDLLRFAAVLLVLLYHASLYKGADPVTHWFSERLHTGGWAGVDLFFVLSGFLVSGLLFREYLKYGTLKIKQFYLRRGLKIYPSYYLFWLVATVPTLAWIVYTKESTAARAVVQAVKDLIFVEN